MIGASARHVAQSAVGIGIIRMACKFCLKFLQRGAPAVETMVNLRVDKATNDAADNHPQHAEERNGRVSGSKMKGRMEQDEGWADDAHDHVNTKPVFQRTPSLHPRHMLAQWIGQH